MTIHEKVVEYLGREPDWLAGEVEIWDDGNGPYIGIWNVQGIDKIIFED